MALSFKQWLAENDDPVAAWKALRQSAGWGDAKQPQPTPQMARVEPIRPPESTPSGLSPMVVDAVRKGFQTGGVVPDNLVRLLQLNGRNYSLVADGSMYVGRWAYPFYKEKHAGKHTGRVLFVKDFPIDSFLRQLSQLG